jgi:hypothetical protein
VGLLVGLAALYVVSSGPAQLLIAKGVISFETFVRLYGPLYRLSQQAESTEGLLITYWARWAEIGGAAPWVPR